MDQNDSEFSRKPKSKIKFPSTVTDYELQLPAWSLDGLKASAMELRLCRPQSLAWAIMLNAVPPPCGDIMASMRMHRNFYEDMKSKLSMDPRTAEGDDPLSQNDESVWKQHFCDNELKALILLDVMRTFPEEVFFRDKEVQDMMVRVLFVWSRAHPHVGYRQGMHEVLAPLVLELRQDRQLAPASLSDTLKYYLDESCLEADSFMLFSAVMKGLQRFYSTGDVVPSSCGRLPTSTAVHNPNEVVRYLERIRVEYLVPLDPELAAFLTDHNITMELFGIRWLRLLFGREFPRSELPPLWSLLFSGGGALPLLPHVLLAMLLSVRALLMEGDGEQALSHLMRAHAAPARHVCALALHLHSPAHYRRPPPPPPPPLAVPTTEYNHRSSYRLEQGGAEGGATSDSGSEGVAEGADVARELAALALLRAQLPAAAHALARALPNPPPHVQRPLQHILQLAALLQCRNHALIDVETALEADESQNTDKVGRKQLVPISMIGGKRTPIKQRPKLVGKAKEVPLKVFMQSEGDSGNKHLPSLDPLGLRTE